MITIYSLHDTFPMRLKLNNAIIQMKKKIKSNVHILQSIIQNVQQKIIKKYC